jgi:hypothetical protein
VTWKNANNLFVAFIIGIVVGYFYREEPKTLSPPNIETITKDSIIRDSIYIINDSIRTEILYLEQKYDEETTAIMSSSDSVNLEFFTRYLEDYKRSTENSQFGILGTQEVLGTDSLVKSTNN